MASDESKTATSAPAADTQQAISMASDESKTATSAPAAGDTQQGVVDSKVPPIVQLVLDVLSKWLERDTVTVHCPDTEAAMESLRGAMGKAPFLRVPEARSPSQAWNACREKLRTVLREIEVAERTMGDVRVDVMTVAEALEQYGAVSVHLPKEDGDRDTALSPMELWDEELRQVQVSTGAGVGTDGRYAVNIAARSGPTTLSQVLQMAKQGKVHTMEVLLRHFEFEACAAYTYSSGLADKVKHPHLWMYTSGGDAIAYYQLGCQLWNRVLAILPTGAVTKRGHTQHYVLAIEGAILKERMYTCCFPSFLKPEYERTCGAAFEALNTTLVPGKPTEGPYMAGIGIRVEDNGWFAGEGGHGRLMVRINGGMPNLLTQW